MDREYPKWMYGPGEESRIFERGDVIPKGWKDHPDKVKEEAPKRSSLRKVGDDKDKAPPEQDGSAPVDDPPPTEEERVATIAELRAAGAEISDDATVEEINAAIDKLTSQQGS